MLVVSLRLTTSIVSYSQRRAPDAASDILASAWSMVKLAAFWRGGNSTNVSRNWLMIYCAA
jgi:hypothetical protein